MNDFSVSFEGQVGLITGAAGGLGLAYARLLARLGAQVLMHDVGADTDGEGTDPQRLDAAVQTLRREGLQVEPVHGFLDTRAQCRALIKVALQARGRLDFIIHNAGWVEYQNITEVDDAHLARMLAIAAKAPLWLAQAAWPVMQAQGGGRIVVTTSDRALFPQYVQHGLASYAMAKMAALGVVHALAAEGRQENILVNAISPVAKTRMWGVSGEPDELLPASVAPGVAWLVSPHCQATGWILRASNGQFRALKLEDDEAVVYPRDLRAVHANSVEAVAAQWHVIAARA